MSIRCFIHSLNKRAETTALLDSGATENFVNERYARRLHLPVRRLPFPRKIINVDGSPNTKGDIQFFTDFEVQSGDRKVNMRFFITEIGDRDLILGYPWFAAIQPKIDWAKGWIDYSQLPVVLRSREYRQPPQMGNFGTKNEKTYLAIGSFPKIGTKQTVSSQLAGQTNPLPPPILPKEYKHHTKVFSEIEAQRFPGPRLWDHAIELKPDAPSTLPGKIYALTQKEQEALE